MKNKFFTVTLIALAGLLLTRCSNKDQEFTGANISDYVNPAPGKYITYRLDSTVRKPFDDTGTTVHSYLAKDVIDAAITDNLGRPAFRVIRYLNDTLGAGTWIQNMTYMLVPGRESVELIENNFRYIKLVLPLRDDFSWKGNKYINTDVPPTTQEPDYSYLDDWDYTYSNTDESFTPYLTQLDSTITINQRDEILGTPNNVDAYSEKNYAQEVYAKGIGLVYRTFSHWLFQPRNSNFVNGSIEGYGITLRIVDHN
jgi:hypothetical protein